MLRTNRDTLNRASSILIVSNKTNEGTLKAIKKDMEGVDTPYEVAGPSLPEKIRKKIHDGWYDLVLQRGKNGEIGVHLDYQHLMGEHLRKELAAVA